MRKVRLELQYFHCCHNSAELLRRVQEALVQCDEPVEFREVIVDSPSKAVEVKFRGAPTLLVNGEDFLGMPEPATPRLACRLYSDGLPETAQILGRLKV